MNFRRWKILENHTLSQNKLFKKLIEDISQEIYSSPFKYFLESSMNKIIRLQRHDDQIQSDDIF